MTAEVEIPDSIIPELQRELAELKAQLAAEHTARAQLRFDIEFVMATIAAEIAEANATGHSHQSNSTISAYLMRLHAVLERHA